MVHDDDNEKQETLAERLEREEREARPARLAAYLLDPAPDLDALCRAHGGYHRITPEAWAAYDRQLAAWKMR